MARSYDFFSAVFYGRRTSTVGEASVGTRSYEAPNVSDELAEAENKAVDGDNGEALF